MRAQGRKKRYAAQVQYFGVMACAADVPLQYPAKNKEPERRQPHQPITCRGFASRGSIWACFQLHGLSHYYTAVAAVEGDLVLAEPLPGSVRRKLLLRLAVTIGAALP